MKKHRQLAAANGVDHFDLVACGQRGRGQLALRHNLFVDFDSDTTPAQAKLLDQVGSGEASGQLENMLSKAAQQQEREMDDLISTLLNILEPGMIILMGIMVLSMVVALLLPIFEMNKLVL